MARKNSTFLFNTISPIYRLFYGMQKTLYTSIIEGLKDKVDIGAYHSILDIGCGTGAFCSVLAEKGLSVTGIDPAGKMLAVGKGKTENRGITFLKADVLDGLPFEEKSFDLTIASYVAHGLQPEERRQMYAEMSRVSRELVIIHDYNQERSPLTSFIEGLEGGDYFRFIEEAEREMRDCWSQDSPCFSDVKVVDVEKQAAWYICKPY